MPDPQNGRRLSFREAVRDAMSQAMRRDPEVFIMGQDIAEHGGSQKVTLGMIDEFGPERVRNTPISEMAMTGAGIGAAMMGMRPIVEIMYEDFLTLAMEQLVNHAAKERYMSGGQLKVPLTVRTQGGAGWSSAAQHGQQTEGWFTGVPGLKVVYPSTPGAGCSGRRSTTTTACSSSSTSSSTTYARSYPKSWSRFRLGRPGSCGRAAT
jgi:pyruvate dehydrogenase E1 component beta subunit